MSAAPKRCARQGSGHSSLITTGTPCSGPLGAAASISRERSGKVSTTALIAGLRSSMRARVASSSSAGSRSPRAIAAACSRRGRSSAFMAPWRGRDRAPASLRRGRPRSGRGFLARTSGGPRCITAMSISSASIPREASPAGMNSSAGFEASISAGNPTGVSWPGSCRGTPAPHSPDADGRIGGRNRAVPARVCLETCLQLDKSDGQEPRAHSGSGSLHARRSRCRCLARRRRLGPASLRRPRSDRVDAARVMSRKDRQRRRSDSVPG